ncbi:MAG: NUDIX hydrolase [Gammaproteobacteria bacterium]
MSKPRPVQPRPAASLIIYRQRGGALEILMGCRNSKARFKPGVYVFPGGMLERSDHFVTPATELDKGFSERMGVGRSTSRAQALAVAAIRETFEEVGLIAGSKVDFQTSNHVDWRVFSDAQIAPNLQALDYIGRAITPAHQPIRFDARFFSIAEQHVEGDIKDNGELTDVRWIDIRERESFNMMKVTHLMLDILAKRLTGEETRSPFLYFVNMRPIMKWC